MKNYHLTILISSLLSSSAFATTLSDALINTYQHNPELISARERLKETDEQIYKAIAGFLPDIQYTARKSYEKDNAAVYSSPGVNGAPTQYNTIQQANWDHIKTRETKLSLQQNVFAGGRTVMAVQIAKFTIDAGRAALLNKEQEILGNAIQAFLQVIYAKNILEINKANVLAFEKRYETIKERVAAGVDKQADFARTAADKANAYTELTNASGNYEQALAAYIKETGLEAEDLIAQTLGTLPKNQMDLLRFSLATNPDLQAVIFQQKAADINVISNAAALLPKVDIGGAIGKNWKQQSDNPTAQPWTHTKSIFFQVSIPVFNQGLTFSNTREAKAGAAKLKYIAKNAKASVIQGSSKVWASHASRQEAINSSKEAVNAGIVALEGAQQAYDEGIASLTDLLNVQNALFQYKTTLARVEFEAENSRYAILALMGKLNAKDLALQTKLYNPAANYDKIKLRFVGF